MKKLIIDLVFNEYEKALIYEAIDESIDRKTNSLGETLKDDIVELAKKRKLFKTKFCLYNGSKR